MSGRRAAATNAATFSGGVGGRMPCPRFTTCPPGPAARRAARTAAVTPSGVPRSAPGVREFGEHPGIDLLIRKYGYVNTPAVLNAVAHNPDLASNLSAAAHLIHGSSEGRFTITYCPGRLTKEEIEGVNFRYADLAAMMKRFDPAKLHDGKNVVDGEEIFYISNPALGLWAHADRFSEVTATAAEDLAVTRQ